MTEQEMREVYAYMIELHYALAKSNPENRDFYVQLAEAYAKGYEALDDEPSVHTNMERPEPTWRDVWNAFKDMVRLTLRIGK